MELLPQLDTLGDLSDEVVRARTKFPSPNGLMLALVEEIAEWGNEEDPEKARKELRQIACVALRLIEEEDPLADTVETKRLRLCLAALEGLARRSLGKLCGEEAAARSPIDEASPGT
jgi:hypothetical protein